MASAEKIKIKCIACTALLLILFIVSGCNNTTESSKASSDLSSMTTSTEDTASPTPVLKDQPLQMVAINDQLLLLPALPDVPQVTGSGDMISYLFSYEEKKWIPAAYTANKTDSLTGKHRPFQENYTLDLYQLRFGDFTCYTLKHPGEYNENISRDFLWRLAQGQDIILPESKDFPIAHIFDDLYAVDDRGKLKMISSRKIGSYDYSTIEKESIGDLYRWEWTFQPICSGKDNVIFYLSSREKEFYSIWKLDLDQQTETRFGEDLVLNISGRGSDQLIAILNPNKSSVYSKLISTADSKSFRSIGEDEWYSAYDWLYAQGGTNLILQNGDTHLEVDAGRIFKPFFIDDELILLRSSHIQGREEYLVIHPTGRKYSLWEKSGETGIEEWQSFMHAIFREQLDFNAAQANGITINMN